MTTGELFVEYDVGDRVRCTELVIECNPAGLEVGIRCKLLADEFVIFAANGVIVGSETGPIDL